MKVKKAKKKSDNWNGKGLIEYVPDTLTVANILFKNVKFVFDDENKTLTILPLKRKPHADK